MAGTLLVYDAAFPRARVAAGPILNTPDTAELGDNNYPPPYRKLAIREALSIPDYVSAMADAAKAMGPLDCLILFGHGVVTGDTTANRATIGIAMGSADITSGSAIKLSALRGVFARNARAELWVCEASAAGTSAGRSGTLLCQSIADALGVKVLAAPITQEYATTEQREIEGGGWQSKATFLPWEGTPVPFTPRRVR